MKILRIILINIFLIMTYGCSIIPSELDDYEGYVIPEDQIIDIDVEKVYRDKTPENGVPIKTEDIVELALEDDISIMAAKMVPNILFEYEYELVQNKWDILAINSSDEDKCVTIYWKLMDFQFISDYPTEFLSKANSMMTVGTMIQRVWEMQGVKFVPDSSGYIYWIGTREPNENTDGEECLFLATDIEER